MARRQPDSAQAAHRRSTGASSSAGAFRSRGCRGRRGALPAAIAVGGARKGFILAGSAIVVLQAVLIAALLFQRVRRRDAEKEAAGLSGRLLTAHEDERRRLARELHDDLTQRLARLAIDAGRLEQARRRGRGSAAAMREDLVRLSEDVHALSYRLHPSVLDDLGLVEALRAECDRVARHGDLRVEVDAHGVPDGAARRGVAVPVSRRAGGAEQCRSPRPRERRDRAAVARATRACSSRSATTAAASTPRRRATRASLGLASMRERVRLLRGQLDIESTPGRGTTVVAWVPA